MMSRTRGIQALDSSFGQAELDGDEDAVAVSADARAVLTRPGSRERCAPASPAVQGGDVGVAQFRVEHTEERLLQRVGAPHGGAGGSQCSEGVVLAVGEVIGVAQQRLGVVPGDVVQWQL